jgi:hypothetical protein
MAKKKDATPEEVSKDPPLATEEAATESATENPVVGTGVGEETPPEAATDSLEEAETLTLEQLAEWSKGRWLAGQHQAAEEIEARFARLLEKTMPGAVYVRDEETGDLVITE